MCSFVVWMLRCVAVLYPLVATQNHLRFIGGWAIQHPTWEFVHVFISHTSLCFVFDGATFAQQTAPIRQQCTSCRYCETSIQEQAYPHAPHQSIAIRIVPRQSSMHRWVLHHTGNLCRGKKNPKTVWETTRWSTPHNNYSNLSCMHCIRVPLHVWIKNTWHVCM